MKQIPESDWKKLRDMQEELLSLACERIFGKVEKIAEKRRGREHKAYLDLYKMIKREDRNLGIMFNDLKRSNAFEKLAAWKHNKIISREKYMEFSEETRQIVDFLLGL